MREIRIDDLREPSRSPEEQGVFEFGLGLEVDLTVDGIVADATEATGLEPIEDVTVYDRLAAQVAALEADDGLSGL